LYGAVKINKKMPIIKSPITGFKNNIGMIGMNDIKILLSKINIKKNIKQTNIKLSLRATAE
jgi:hypothetical protein